MENKSLYSPKNIEEIPLEREILVHGAMHYKCKDCGRVFRMWLEKGLEDKIQDAEYPGKHKPVPFTIGCLCGGLMEHVAWHSDIHIPRYMSIRSRMNYFENSEDCAHGVPHLRTDGGSRSHITTSNAANPLCSFKDVIPEVDEMEDKPILESRKSGWEMYSTTQLKEELRRRKRW